jgi:hypothetical protein
MAAASAGGYVPTTRLLAIAEGLRGQMGQAAEVECCHARTNFRSVFVLPELARDAQVA